MDTMLKDKTTLGVLEDWDSFARARAPKADQQFNVKLKEVRELLMGTDGRPAHVSEFMLREVMTTSDFPLLFANTLERELLARFKPIPRQMRQIVRLGKGRDFRVIDRYRVDGLTKRLNKIVEKGEYLADKLDETRYYYNLEKYGRQADFSWEAWKNDDLGAFEDVPGRLAHAVINTEEWFITNLFWAAAGPRAAFFSIANGGAAVATPVLAIGSLEDGVEAMAAFTDPSGEPILNRPVSLVVGPALEFVARQILTSANKMWIVAAAAGIQAYPTTNVISQYGLKLIVNPWIPIVDTTTGATTWALFSDPNQCPAGELGQLRGHENPQIHMKSPDMVRVGGGLTDPFEGDFATDNIIFRVRHIMGGVTMDGQGGYASDGTV